MKKIILILLTAVPVLIVFFTALGAGAIIAVIKSFPVESITIDYNKLKTDPDSPYISLDRLQTLDFEDYITVSPSRANFFTLLFESDTPEVADVENGVLTAKQYMRSSTPIIITIKSSDGLKTFESIEVYVNAPAKGSETEIIDYLAFDLNQYTRSSNYGSYCQIDTQNNKLIIDKSILNDADAKSKLNIPAGLVVGPVSAREQIGSMIQITDGTAIERNGENDYTYSVVSQGEVTFSVSCGGKTATLIVSVE